MPIAERRRDQPWCPATSRRGSRTSSRACGRTRQRIGRAHLDAGMSEHARSPASFCGGNLVKCGLALRLATAVDDRLSTLFEQICPLPGGVPRAVIVVLLDFRCREDRQDVFIIGDETLEAVRQEFESGLVNDRMIQAAAVADVVSNRRLACLGIIPNLRLRPSVEV